MKYFTADWHIGERTTNDTLSFPRPRPTWVMAKEWMAQCNDTLKLYDELYILGDLAITLEDLDFYRELPPSHVFIICGDKETDNENFSYADFREKVTGKGFISGTVNLCTKIENIEIGGRDWRIAHKPEDLMSLKSYARHTPALCGHVHGIWRTQCMPNGMPIVNVGIDAWGGLVSQDYIEHQYTAIVNGFYDRNARVDQWT